MAAFSILTYNMHKGFSGDGRRSFVLPRMRDALALADADVVFLQEAQGEHQRHAERVADWPDAAQFEFLADTLWPHYAYGRNALYDHGHHGNAILSRYPLVAWENIDVSPYPFAASRSLLHGVIEPPGGARLHLVCIHFGFIAAERRPQIRRLCEHIEARIPHDEALVVAGDFNDWGKQLVPIMAECGLHSECQSAAHFTYPARLPLAQLDHVYSRGLHRVRQFVPQLDSVVRSTGIRSWSRLSDHLPLVAEFELDR